MSDSSRRLRSSSKVNAQSSSLSTTSLETSPSAASAIQIIKPGSRPPGLSASDLTLLREKQRKLRTQSKKTLASLPNANPHLRTALEASLIFAQEEAGSAVCVHAAGWVLTCAHCIAESAAEYRAAATRTWWLLSYTGRAVQVACRAWDPRRDLALLQIVAAECECDLPSFASLRPSACAPASGTRIARRTHCPLVFVSSGAFCGMVPGADPHDNSEIGTLRHDAWTYWGHSGAPLVDEGRGQLPPTKPLVKNMLPRSSSLIPAERHLEPNLDWALPHTASAQQISSLILTTT
ncbi:hypothetical protein B0H12DRAFT_1244353 [Mycena haematopus]|nr:hypothetical protein B0H12DRAFT_1244353 [Mycena haematopus]